MALVLSESHEDHPKAPANFPKCNNFILGESKYDVHHYSKNGINLQM